jgi:alcohol dehydrogenase class IV
MSLRGDFNYPTKVKAGRGRVAELGACCRELGFSNPLVVTDPGFASLPAVPVLRAALDAEGIPSGLFTGVRPNPIGQNVVDGVAAYHAGRHDGVIAIGGGSALDVAKAVALMAGQSRPLFDYEDVGDNFLRVDPKGVVATIAIPTTAGTGSEVGRASVITDESEHAKKIIFHPKMLPSIVILDPELTYGLPPFLTAATGMDALSHSLEAYCAPGFHPLAVGIALEGMRLVANSLEIAHREPTNEAARLEMLVASTMGATAFQRGLGAMHALAHPLGALYDAHHGALNAVLMPYVLVANEAVIAERIAAAARYLALPSPTFAGFLDFVLGLRERLGIPHALSGLGIDDTKLADIGERAVRDPSSGTNPIPFTSAQYDAICRRALGGAL